MTVDSKAACEAAQHAARLAEALAVAGGRAPRAKELAALQAAWRAACSFVQRAPAGPGVLALFDACAEAAAAFPAGSDKAWLQQAMLHYQLVRSQHQAKEYTRAAALGLRLIAFIDSQRLSCDALRANVVMAVLSSLAHAPSLVAAHLTPLLAAELARDAAAPAHAQTQPQVLNALLCRLRVADGDSTARLSAADVDSALPFVLAVAEVPRRRALLKQLGRCAPPAVAFPAAQRLILDAADGAELLGACVRGEVELASRSAARVSASTRCWPRAACDACAALQLAEIAVRLASSAKPSSGAPWELRPSLQRELTAALAAAGNASGAASACAVATLVGAASDATRALHGQPGRCAEVLRSPLFALYVQLLASHAQQLRHAELEARLDGSRGLVAAYSSALGLAAAAGGDGGALDGLSLQFAALLQPLAALADGAEASRAWEMLDRAVRHAPVPGRLGL